MRSCVVVVLVGACGRVSFDPLGTQAIADATDAPFDDNAIIPDVPANTLRRTPSSDTYVALNDATANGTQAAMFVGRADGPQAALMQFDLSTVPVLAISNATLRMRVGAVSGTAGSIMNVTANRITEPWNEIEATWTTRFASTMWATAGGTVIATPVDVTSVSFAVLGTYDWDITTLVNGWIIGGVPNDGVALRFESMPAVGDAVAFDSREHPNDARRPELLITP